MTTFDDELNIINSINIFETYYFNCWYCGEHCQSYNSNNKYCNECYSCRNTYSYDDYYSDCPMRGEKFNNSDCNVCGSCENLNFISCIFCKYEKIGYLENYVCNVCFNEKFKIIENILNIEIFINSQPADEFIYCQNYTKIIIFIQRWWKDIYYHPDNKLAKKLSKNFIKVSKK